MIMKYLLVQVLPTRLEKLGNGYLALEMHFERTSTSRLLHVIFLTGICFNCSVSFCNHLLTFAMKIDFISTLIINFKN